jgi:predicted GIY-YIG superfamily endonuclease
MLYVGLTTDLEKMLQKHREKRISLFKGNFSFEKLVYVEDLSCIESAIKREQELRQMPNHLKHDLLKLTNPGMKCLSNYWFAEKVS